jgi:acetyl-CoA C-acetyltransferase
VLVGVQAVVERPDDPIDAAEPLDLMERALRGAAADAGAPALLAEVDAIWAPRGFWAYPDPGRILAERFGATKVRTVVAEIGILQTTILGRAAAAIAAGESDVAVIVGAEARDRATRLQRAGREVPLFEQGEATPDEVLVPHAEIMGALEVELGLITPTIQYAMIDNALRHHEGQSMEAHRDELARLWGDFNAVAVGNPAAWNPTPMSGEAIVTPDERNRMLAFPYTKHLVSQWNVNQAGALVLCSLERAERLGLDPARFVYPLAVVDAEHMVTLSERRDPWRAPGFEQAGRRSFELLGRSPEEIPLWELYSCFPAAVRIQQRELGLPLDRRVTQTGGMTFGGGPLNNFVVQSWVRMVERMRETGASHGVVTAISGLITKQGVSVLGAEPERTFVHDDVTKETAQRSPTIEVDAGAAGRGRISAYTVSHDRHAAHGVAMMVDLDDGGRALRVVDDPDWMALGEAEELCGRAVEVEVGAGVRWA